MKWNLLCFFSRLGLFKLFLWFLGLVLTLISQAVITGQGRLQPLRVPATA